MTGKPPAFGISTKHRMKNQVRKAHAFGIMGSRFTSSSIQWLLQAKLDCNYASPMDLAPNGIQLGAKSTVKGVNTSQFFEIDRIQNKLACVLLLQPLLLISIIIINNNVLIIIAD